MNEIVIEPGRTEKQYWRDLWSYRELFYFLAWRDILVRYKQTVAGVAWAVLRPLIMMTILTIVFSKLARFSSGTAPYPVYVFSALLPWQFFATAFTGSGNSLVTNRNMISKIYFPRLIVPAASIITCLVDFLISSALLALTMIYYQYAPSPRIFLLPFFIALAFMASFGFGLWVAALMVRFRDFRHMVPFMVQIGMYISPVGYPIEKVPEKWLPLYSLNPMVGVIDGFRWTLLGEDYHLYLPGVAISVVVTILATWSGIRYFRKTERTFADII